MSKKVSKAFSPSGISSFFEICDRTPDGKAITDLDHVGSRGGGFGIQKGVLTEICVSEAKTSSISVYVNGVLAPNAETTQIVLRKLLGKANGTYNIVAKHTIQVPIGAGFGTSAAGALTAGLAFSDALKLPFTYNQIGKIAHATEVECKTGLGTVGALIVGGCVLTIEPGAPGTAIIDRIPLSPDYVIVAGVFGSTPTRQVLSSPEKRQLVNRYGRKTLEAILDEPSIENFLSSCWEFAKKTGFATERVKELVKLAKKAGAVGAAQNMVGEAVHAVTLEENAAAVAEAFKLALPQEAIIVCKIDFQCARLVSEA